MRRKNKDEEALLNTEQLGVAQLYRERNAVVEFLSQQCFSEFDRKDKKNQLIPIHEKVMLRSMWYYSFIYLCCSRRLGKTFCVGYFIAALGGMLSGLPQNIDIGVVSGSMRQVGLNFQELMRAVDNSPLLQSMTVDGPKLSSDSYIWKLKGWKDDQGAYHDGVSVVGLPLGSNKGSAMLRGMGFTNLIIDEFTLVPESSYRALMPTGATSSDPMRDVVRRANINMGKVWTPPVFDPAHPRLIYASTAGYTFIPAFKVFQRHQTNATLNLHAQEILELIKCDYPNKDVYPDFVEKSKQILKYLSEDLYEKYVPIVRGDKSNRSDLVKDFVDYLRTTWYTDKYMCLPLSMDVAPEEWYQEEKIQAIFAMLSDAEIRMEFKAEWLSDSEGLFKASQLQRVTNESIPVENRGDGEHLYIIGVDPAEAKKFGVVVLKVIDQVDMVSAQVIYAREYDVTEEGLDHPNQVKTLYATLNRFSICVAIVVDKGGGGSSIAASMAHQTEPFQDTWGEFNQPVLSVDLDEEEYKELEGEPLLWLLPMDNPMVTDTNRRALAAIQSGRLLFAGMLPRTSEEDAPFYDLGKLKSQMSKLVPKPVGNQIKFDLPSNPDDARHIHDLWSAFTLAYKGYLEYIEGSLITKRNQYKSPVGFWGKLGW